MIDAYKRVLVGQYEEAEVQETNLLEDELLQEKAARAAQGQNPQALEYGTKQGEIVEFYITDDRGVRSNAILKNAEFTIHMKVKFIEDIKMPIFAFSIKNVIGVEITGTNSMVEKAYLDGGKAGEVKEITFTQKMTLQGGEYLLSLGLTGYSGDVFEVYHRLYDVINITVVSDKDTVGYYDMNSRITVTDI